MKVTKISLFLLILLSLGNMTNSFAVNTVTKISRIESHEQTKVGRFLAKAKIVVVKTMMEINKNLKYCIILWLGGGVLTMVGALLAVFVIGIPLVVLGGLTMFAGTFFFYMWIIDYLKA